MSGQRNVMDSTGETYETLADHLVGRFASTIRVSRQQDYGIDLYCLPRVPTGPRTQTAIELGSVQVRGGASDLVYGGLNGRGEWKGHEFDWLRGLTVPLYLARVDAACSTVNLFSLWPIWWVFLHAGNPFKIVFTTEPASSEIYKWRSPEALADKDGAGIGDGLRWNVNLGAPFLQLTGDNLGDAAFRDQASAILQTWIKGDRLTLIRSLQGVPVIDSITQWTTNSVDSYGYSTHQFWNSAPGANIPRLCKTLAPVLTNLGVHLQWQTDEAAYRLIPILEWLDQQHQLDEIGRGLLDGLRRMQAAGVKPERTTPGPLNRG